MTQSTYTIVAGDGQTYGPSAHNVIQSWIDEGRIARDTQMARSDVAGWFRAGDYQEFAWPADAAPAAAAVPATAPAKSARVQSGRVGLTIEDMDPVLLAEMRSHVAWFWWVAGLELVFGIINRNFVGIAVFGIPLLIIGFFARRAHRWAFVIGILLLALRLLEAVLGGAWLPAAIRAWAVFELFKGLMIAHSMQKRMKEG
jgi:hypothetical protein